MANINIQFKEKHLCYVVSFMTGVVAGQVFPALVAARETLQAGSYGPEDLVTVAIEPSLLMEIYSMLGGNPERTGSGINSEMKAVLVPQLIALATGGNQEVLDIVTRIGQSEAEVTQYNEAIIQRGRSWLLN